MNYWLKTLIVALGWITIVVGVMFFHTRGQDAFLQQKYLQIAACGFAAIWAFAILLRIGKKPPKMG